MEVGTHQILPQVPMTKLSLPQEGEAKTIEVEEATKEGDKDTTQIILVINNNLIIKDPPSMEEVEPPIEVEEEEKVKVEHLTTLSNDTSVQILGIMQMSPPRKEN